MAANIHHRNAKDRISIVGKVFERLTVLDFAPTGKQGHIMCQCLCQCGQEIVTSRFNILNGKTKSCGCLKKDKNAALHWKHGESHVTAEHKSWRSMKDRCLNRNNPAFERYGGRGITICEEWIESYESFLLAMGRKPTASHSLDRVDNSKGYEPSNCRWATKKEQANNRRARRWGKKPK